MSSLDTTVRSIAMLAAFALAGFGARQLWRGGEGRFKGVLMLVMAAVLVGNVLVWTV